MGIFSNNNDRVFKYIDYLKYGGKDKIIKYFDYFESKISSLKIGNIKLYLFKDELSELLKKEGITENFLQKTSNDMCEYLGITIKPLIFFEKGTKMKDSIGNFSGGLILANSLGILQPRIAINNDYLGGFYDYLAVLAHEICHYYLVINNAELSNKKENEVFTDLIAVYLGFGHILEVAYIEENNTIWRYYLIFIQEITTKKKIGYIDTFAIADAMKESSKRRGWSEKDYIEARKLVFDFKKPSNNDLKNGLIIGGIMIIIIVVIKIITLYL